METRRIYEIKLTQPGTHPEHITHFKWVDNLGKYWTGPRSEMVKFVRANPRGAAYTLVQGARADLRAVEHWVQTYADHTSKDNLLNLPQFFK